MVEGSCAAMHSVCPLRERTGWNSLHLCLHGRSIVFCFMSASDSALFRARKNKTNVRMHAYDKPIINATPLLLWRIRQPPPSLPGLRHELGGIMPYINDRLDTSPFIDCLGRVRICLNTNQRGSSTGMPQTSRRDAYECRRWQGLKHLDEMETHT